VGAAQPISPVLISCGTLSLTAHVRGNMSAMISTKHSMQTFQLFETRTTLIGRKSLTLRAILQEGGQSFFTESKVLKQSTPAGGPSGQRTFGAETDYS
jgi:hypothetical protein